MTPLTTSFRAILLRELRTLRRQVEAYPDDGAPWQPVPGIANVGGTLVLHLCGNLRHFVGARLGGTGYVRDRALEFARRDVPRAELLAEVDAAIADVDLGLSRADDAVLATVSPDVVTGSHLEQGELLLHVLAHVAYHLGQVDYHRRAVTGENVAVPGLRASELPSARPAT